MPTDTIALVPARGGSRGVPNKNVRPFLGRPLLEWSLEVAEQCPSVYKTILSSDSEDYLRLAEGYPKSIGLLRPSELAGDETPMSAVISQVAGSQSDARAVFLVLLDPTSPFRNPTEVEDALESLRSRPESVGAVSISEPHFNMRWVGVVKDHRGSLARAFPGGSGYARRQDVPPLWRMNGAFYIWRMTLAAQLADPWLELGSYLGIETPEERAFSIDTLHEFAIAEALFRAGLIDWEVGP